MILLALALLTETMIDAPLEFPGRGPREILTIEEAPLLKSAYATFKKSLPKNASEKEIFEKLVAYIGNTLFDPSKATKEKAAYLIFKNSDGSRTPRLPLELFLKNRTGVCRHQALTLAYFTHELAKENLIQGITRLVRGSTPQGRHAWVEVDTPKGTWHLDPLKQGVTYESALRMASVAFEEGNDQEEKYWDDEAEKAENERGTRQ